MCRLAGRAQMLLLLASSSGALAIRGHGACGKRVGAIVMTAPPQQATAITDWIDLFDNSLLRDLRTEPADCDPYESRQVTGAHYTRLRPTVASPRPALVVHSAAVAKSLGLDPTVCESEEFLRFFAGSPPEDAEWEHISSVLADESADAAPSPEPSQDHD